MKYTWIDAQGLVFDLTEMCAVLEVSVSGYRARERGGTPRRKRMHSTLGYKSPAQFLRDWLSSQLTEKQVA